MWHCRYSSVINGRGQPPIILISWAAAPDPNKVIRIKKGREWDPSGGSTLGDDIKKQYPPGQRIYVGSDPNWNGKIVENGSFPSELLKTSNGGTTLVADIVDKWSQLEKAYENKFGFSFTPASGIRTYEKQVELKRKWTADGLPHFAATPGTSKHGWGLGIDMTMRDSNGKKIGLKPPPGVERKDHPAYDSEPYKWLVANAPTYGFHNPPWARQTSPKTPWEPWHFEWIDQISILKKK